MLRPLDVTDGPAEPTASSGACQQNGQQQDCDQQRQLWGHVPGNSAEITTNAARIVRWRRENEAIAVSDPRSCPPPGSAPYS